MFQVRKRKVKDETRQDETYRSDDTVVGGIDTRAIGTTRAPGRASMNVAVAGMSRRAASIDGPGV